MPGILVLVLRSVNRVCLWSGGYCRFWKQLERLVPRISKRFSFCCLVLVHGNRQILPEHDDLTWKSDDSFLQLCDCGTDTNTEATWAVENRPKAFVRRSSDLQRLKNLLLKHLSLSLSPLTVSQERKVFGLPYLEKPRLD